MGKGKKVKKDQGGSSNQAGNALRNLVTAIQNAEMNNGSAVTPEEALIESGEEAMVTYFASIASPAKRKRFMADQADTEDEEEEEEGEEMDEDEPVEKPKAPEPAGDVVAANASAMPVAVSNAEVRDPITVERASSGGAGASGSTNRDLIDRQTAAHAKFKKLMQDKKESK